MNISDQIFSTYESDSSYYVSSENNNKGNALLAMFIVNVLLGFPINSYVIWLIVTGAGNGLAAEFFSLNLSICEIFSCVKVILQMIRNKHYIPSELSTILDAVGIAGRPLFQCLICVERYLAVVHPVTFLKLKPLRYRVICCAVAWVATLLYGGILIVTSLFNASFYISYMVQFPVFLSIQLFCLVAVLRALKQSGPGERGRKEENHMKRRAFYLILLNVVAMLIIYGPYMVSIILLNLGKTNETLIYICCAGFLFGVLVQPFLFVCRVGKLPFINSK